MIRQIGHDVVFYFLEKSIVDVNASRSESRAVIVQDSGSPGSCDGNKDCGFAATGGGQRPGWIAAVLGMGDVDRLGIRKVLIKRIGNVHRTV